MKTPKMLPWLARKAGISEARAEALWVEAIRHATVQTGWVGTPEYLRIATERWNELIAAESELAGSPISPMASAQAKLVMLPFIAWQGYSVVAASAWQRLWRCTAKHLA